MGPSALAGPEGRGVTSEVALGSAVHRLGRLYEFTAFHLALRQAAGLGGDAHDTFARRVLGDLEIVLDQLDSVR